MIDLLSCCSHRRASSVTSPRETDSLRYAGILALATVFLLFDLPLRGVFEGVIGKVGTTTMRIAERWLIPGNAL